MPTVRSQDSRQIQWLSVDTKSLPADEVFYNSDDFTVNSNMIAIGYTVFGNSAGTDSNDIIEVYCQIKRDPDNSSSGVPDTYDSSRTFLLSLDCSSGSDTQESGVINTIMAGDIIRFACRNIGTNAITVGIQVIEDKITF